MTAGDSRALVSTSIEGFIRDGWTVKVHDHNGGKRAEFCFPNGWGASLIQGPYSYGGPDGLFELAVLGAGGHLEYRTPITSDVKGYLTADEARGLLDDIAALPAGRDAWREEFRAAEELTAAGLQAEADRYVDGHITLTLSIADARRVAALLSDGAR